MFTRDIHDNLQFLTHVEKEHNSNKLPSVTVTNIDLLLFRESKILQILLVNDKFCDLLVFFAGLVAGLGLGALAEVTKRQLGLSKTGKTLIIKYNLQISCMN